MMRRDKVATPAEEEDESHLNPFLSHINKKPSSSKLQFRYMPAQKMFLIVLEVVIQDFINFWSTLCLFWKKRRKEISKVQWHEKLGLGEVVEKKGSIWTSTGIVRDGKLYCHIEEILYVVMYFLPNPSINISFFNLYSENFLLFSFFIANSLFLEVFFYSNSTSLTYFLQCCTINVLLAFTEFTLCWSNGDTIVSTAFTSQFF